MYGNVKLNRLIFLCSIPLILYLMAIILQLETLSNFLSILCSFVAGMVMIEAYAKSRKEAKRSIVYLFCAMACFIWGIGDAVWALIAATGVDPSQNEVLWVIYAVPNLMFVVGFILIILPHLNKWSTAQLLNDILTVILIAALFLWTIYFEENIETVQKLLTMDFTSLASVVLDILIGVLVLQWVVSVRNNSIPQHSKLLLFGLLLFSIVDLSYFYALLHEQYIPNGLIDFGYSLSFFCMSIGAIVWSSDISRGEKGIEFSNIGVKRKWLWLCALPLGAIILQTTNAVKVPLNYTILAIFVLLVVQNWWASKYIQLSLENANLLKQAKEQNEILETVVHQQIQKLSDVSNKDTMTMLLNRQFFVDLLDSKSSGEGQPTFCCLMVMDIDRLNAINKVYGTDAGDFVIIECAKRLLKWNIYEATLSRLAGDEYGIHLCGDYTNEQLVAFCMEILAIMREAMYFDQKRIDITVSIGMVALRESALNAKTMLQNAEMALDQAKSLGYDQFYLLDSGTYESMKETSRIEVLLAQSQIDYDFELFYQPQFSLPEGKLVGAEALLRWYNPDMGYIPPSIFIPVAEKIGIIGKLGKWVLHEAIQQAKRWNENREQKVKIGINVSPTQLKEEDIVSIFAQELEESGIDPGWLDIEITESIMLQCNDATQRTFKELSDLGLSISIDDFGSGHASFGYLSIFPFRTVKIDKLIMDNTSKDNINGIHVLKSIIDMAKMIGIQTIAEGVETEEQMELLKYLGCNQVQGYIMGRPVRISEFEKQYLNL